MALVKQSGLLLYSRGATGVAVEAARCGFAGMLLPLVLLLLLLLLCPAAE